MRILMEKRGRGRDKLEIRGSEEGRGSLPEERERGGDKADRTASAREKAAGSWRRFPATLQAVLALASKFVSKSKRKGVKISLGDRA
jgi:hypothetical protein